MYMYLRAYVDAQSLSQVRLRSHGLQTSRLLCLWVSPGKNTGVDCHFLLQGLFLREGLNSISCTGRRILYHCPTWEVHVYIYIHIFFIFQIRFHYRLLEDIEYSSLHYIVYSCCLPVLYIVVCIC